MLETLLESRVTRRRSAGGAVASWTAHTALIAAAVYATAPPHVSPVTRVELVRPVYFPPARTRLTATATKQQVPGTNGGWRLPVVKSIDVHLPPVPDIRVPMVASATFQSRPLSGSGTEPVGSANTASGEAYTAGQVEKQVEVAPGNLPPRYPDALRDRGVEGEVIAQFVVDEAGRAEEGSLRFMRTDNVLFEEAVRTALRRMRFVPAEVGGRKVRQLVQMPFVFTIGK